MFSSPLVRRGTCSGASHNGSLCVTSDLHTSPFKYNQLLVPDTIQFHEKPLFSLTEQYKLLHTVVYVLAIFFCIIFVVAYFKRYKNKHHWNLTFASRFFKSANSLNHYILAIIIFKKWDSYEKKNVHIMQNKYKWHIKFPIFCGIIPDWCCTLL